MKKFFLEQEKILKATKDLINGDTIIVLDKSEEFEKYLKDGIPINAKIPEEKDLPKDDIESVD